MSEGHAKLSPSGMHRILGCPGSVVLEKGEPDVESEYAREGTAAHEYAAIWLNTRIPPLLPWKAKNGFEILNGVSSTSLMDGIREYVQTIQDFSKGHYLLVEESLPIDHITGEKDASGTGDSVIVYNDGETIAVDDLKMGMGVKVYARKNPQLMMYALGALHKYSALGDFKRFILRIHQVRLDHLDSWECSLEELLAFAEEVKAAIEQVKKAEKSNSLEGFLHPSEEACKWCKAKYKCPALASIVAEETAADFDSVDQVMLVDPPNLSKALKKLDLIELWAKGIRSKAEIELLAGREVKGFKLVEGKKGNRDWADDAQAEAGMKAIGIDFDDMYNTALSTPTKLEKKIKKKHPALWDKVQPLITCKRGKPSVAPVDDPRPALTLDPSSDFSATENTNEG